MILDKILSDLKKIYNSVGYLTADDIVSISEREHLSIRDVDLLYERVTSSGISIHEEAPDVIDESLIPHEEVTITITFNGYIIRTPMSLYQRQWRGGRGRSVIELQNNDSVIGMYTAASHDYLLIFTNIGRMYRLKVHEIPESQRLGRGTSMNTIVPLGPNEAISHVISIPSIQPDDIYGKYLVFATRNGLVKKTDIAAYVKVPKTGLDCISLRFDDELVCVSVTEGDQDIILLTRGGMTIRFSEVEVRAMGRETTGMIGIQLGEDDRVVSMGTFCIESSVLLITTRGFGKRTTTIDYRKQGRGGKGYTSINCTQKNGWVKGQQLVDENDEIIIVTAAGITLRTSVAQVSEMGRNTQGVRLINLPEDDELVAVSRIAIN